MAFMKILRVASRLAASEKETFATLALILDGVKRDLISGQHQFDSQVMKCEAKERPKCYTAWWSNMYKVASKLHQAMDNRAVADHDDVRAAIEAITDEFDLLEMIPTNRQEHTLGFDHSNDPKTNPEKLKHIEELANIDDPRAWATKMKDRFGHVNRAIEAAVRAMHSKATMPGGTLN